MEVQRAEEQVEERKYFAGPVIQKFREEKPFELPTAYGENRIVLMVRDPEWLYIYWDIADTDRDALRMAPERFSESLVIRLHDITGIEDFNGINSISWYELPVGRSQSFSWYVHLPQSDREWCGELGVLNDQGEFIQICRSCVLGTPTALLRHLVSEFQLPRLSTRRLKA